jgi:hypothetical protein
MDVAMPDQKYLSSLSAAADFFERFGPLMGFVLLIGFVLFRTRSLFFVFYRIQSLIGGAQAFHDERVQRHWKSFEDMHRLNLWFGLNLTSSRAMHQLFAWLDRHNVSVGEIARSLPYFNPNTLQFTFPKRWVVKLDLSWRAVVASVVFLIAGVFGATDYALLYVKKTHTLFWVGSGHAYSADYPISSLFENGGSWHIRDDYCLFTDAPDPLHEEWDKQVICHLVLGNRDDYIQEAMQSQKWSSAVFFVLFLFIAVPPLRMAVKRQQALSVQKRIVEAPNGGRARKEKVAHGETP